MGSMTDQRVINLFRRYQITPTDIKYMIHSQQRTTLYLADGREVLSSLPLKVLFANLPQREFWSIQKGIVIRIEDTVKISECGIYTMIDGRQFKGRTRNPAEHKRRSAMLSLPAPAGRSSPVQQWSILDNAPIAFCILEPVFSGQKLITDFIFLYANDRMQQLAQCQDMERHSFYKILSSADPQWISCLSEVILNGTQKTIHSTAANRKVTARCFQPFSGCCAFFLTEDAALSQAERQK